MIFTGRRSLLSALNLLSIILPVFSQTYSSCNPLQGTCPADPALGKSVNIDFTQGASSLFASSGNPTYGSNGAVFTIARSGDSPTISSKYYIMFGHVEFVLKAAPGTGIVSSAILQSDDLDERDFEWLGGDNSQVQSNYFGKGETVTGYNRGAFHGAASNHDQFHTYTIDWTKDQIVWQVDGQTVRVLTPATAETNQYPQTPMMIKVGIWAGGDPANPPGTIAWAGGQTDYTQGPFSMYLKSIKMQDYSTGTSYSYSGTSGTWESIQSNGGVVYSGSTGKDSPAVSGAPSYSTASGAPIPLTTDAAASSVYATRTGYPWVVATASIITSTTSAPYSSISGLPSGWSISSSGKVVPPSAGSLTSPYTSYSVDFSSDSSSVSEVDIITSYDQQGFPTVITITTAVAGQPKSYYSSDSTYTLTGSDVYSDIASLNAPQHGSVTVTNQPVETVTIIISASTSTRSVTSTGTARPQGVAVNDAVVSNSICSISMAVAAGLMIVIIF